ncbi:MAG: uroporphyrinogen decarboxylase family protein [Terrimicrobiaceae bacterium]
MTPPKINVPSESEKREVWKSYGERRPVRVPLRWNVNARIILLDPRLNPEGWGFRDHCSDPAVTMAVQSRFQEYVAAVLSRTCDFSGELPAQWAFTVDNQNIYDSAYFGAEVFYEPGQTPATHQFLTLDDLDEFLKRDFSRPLENPWIRDRLEFHAQLTRAAESFTYLGRKGVVQPFNAFFDGPVTVATNLFGSEVFVLMADDPDKARELFMTITRAALLRNRALAELAGGWKKADVGWIPDDSILLISAEMLEELVIPVHEFWLSETSNTTAEGGHRNMHLCGDATRLFPLLHRKLGIDGFDTGFPVDHGALRAALGPDVEISGGPEVALLKDGTPEQCHERAAAILRSGIMDGGRFILQEGNNLPPCVPLANLEAVYDACQEFGRYNNS